MATKLRQVDEYRWEVPQEGKMRTRGVVYASRPMVAKIRRDQSLEQVANVACLPGIVGASLAMPDMHWGYGFPIGGVAAVDPDDGAVSPGGVGYDINCGVRLLRDDRLPPRGPPRLHAGPLPVSNVPTGVGASADPPLSGPASTRCWCRGPAGPWRAASASPGTWRTARRGALGGADPAAVGDRARERGADQLGTLGSGNHFLEVGYVAEVFDELAAAFGLVPGDCRRPLRLPRARPPGLRGLSRPCSARPCTASNSPTRSWPVHRAEPPAGEYLAAMAAAANYAWANRQHDRPPGAAALRARLPGGPRDLGLELVYDVAHNVAKIEEHLVDGEAPKPLRPPQGRHPGLPARPPGVPGAYRRRASRCSSPATWGGARTSWWGPEALTETFGSTCHGAGREMSRAPGHEGGPGPRHRPGAGRPGHRGQAPGASTSPKR